MEAAPPKAPQNRKRQQPKAPQANKQKTETVERLYRLICSRLGKTLCDCQACLLLALR